MVKNKKPTKRDNKSIKIEEKKFTFPTLSKKSLLILGIPVVMVIVGLILGGVYLYYNPYKNISINKDGNEVLFKKVPFYPTSLVVEKDGEEVHTKTLPLFSITGKESVDFSEDGFYKVVYEVGGKTFKEEFEIDRTAPVITTEYKEVTNTEKEIVKLSIDEEGSISMTYTVTDVDEESGEGTEREVTEEVKTEKEVLLVEGENIFMVEAEDEWGNVAEEEVKILADFTDPEIEYLQPKYSETYRSSETIKVKVTDENLDKVKINGKDIEEKDGVYALDVTWDWGEHGITIEAEDIAGNKTVFEHSVIRKAGAVERVEVVDGGGDGGSYTPPPPTPACNNGLSGYNVFCWLNEERKSAGLAVAGWSSGKSAFATDYAYCLETTGFSIYSNPHDPTQAVLDCMTAKGRDGSDAGRLANGAEVIAANLSTAKLYSDRFMSSPTHKGYIFAASSMGFGIYGKWCVGYTQ